MTLYAIEKHDATEGAWKRLAYFATREAAEDRIARDVYGGECRIVAVKSKAPTPLVRRVA